MKLTALIVSATLLAGCSSAPQANNDNAPAVRRANSNAGQGVISNDNASNAPSGTPDMRGISSDPNAPVPEANAVPQGTIQAARRGREIVEGPPPPAGSKAPSAPAGDDSSITTEMLRDGSVLERRVFTRDPELQAVEVKTSGSARSAQLILRNGKKVPLKASRLPSIGAPTAAEFLQMAGLRAAPSASDKGGATKSKSVNPQ